jgi:hypothetical protein
VESTKANALNFENLEVYKNLLIKNGTVLCNIIFEFNTIILLIYKAMFLKFQNLKFLKRLQLSHVSKLFHKGFSRVKIKDASQGEGQG